MNLRIKSLTNDPGIALYKIDLVNRRALLVRLSEQEYRRATVLDDRALSAQTQGLWVPLESVVTASTKITGTRPPHFIFHVGHCGSTLISRLLGELPDCFALREPVPLFLLAYARRTLDLSISRVSAERWQQLFEIVLKLLGRTYCPGARSLVKPTSVCANLVGPALQTHAESRTILLYVSLKTYLASMLRDESFREYVRDYAPAWVGDLNKLTDIIPLHLYALSDAELVVLAWLGAMTAFMKAMETRPKHTLLVNFDVFIKEPAKQLEQAALFLQLRDDPRQIRELVQGRLMHTYAKDFERPPYNAQTRRAELNASHQHFAREIRAGMTWGRHLVEENKVMVHLAPYLNCGES